MISGGPYEGGTSRRTERLYVAEARELPFKAVWAIKHRHAKTVRSDPITFLEEDLVPMHRPHSDSMVVRAVIGNRTVHRLLIDNGSLVNILYQDALEKRGLGDATLRPMTQSLCGFTGDFLVLEGIISLLVTLGERPLRATSMIDFVVVN